MNDEALIHSCKTGDKEAWYMLVNKYSNLVFSIAYNFTADSDEAEDVLQEVFIKFFNKIKEIEGDFNIKSWLVRVTKNYCIDIWRKRKRNNFINELNENIDSQAKTPEEELLEKHKKEILESSISELENDFKILIILRDIEGLSYEEISESLKIPIGTVKSRLNRARVLLLKKVRSKEDGM